MGRLILAVVTSLGIMCMLTACGEQEVKIIVENYTGEAITDLRVTTISNSDCGNNKLEYAIQDTDYCNVLIGSFSEKDINGGFSVLISNNREISLVFLTVSTYTMGVVCRWIESTWLLCFQ